MSKNPFEKIKSETRLVEKIALFIPGYRGYKLKELRREADKLIRNYIYQKLSLTKEELKVIFQRLVENNLSQVWKDVDRLVINLDTVASEINHASYGYSGFFDAIKIQENNLDTMLDYDTKLVDNTEILALKVKQFKDDVLNASFEKTSIHIKDIRKEVDLLDSLYHDRKNIILGV